MNDRSPHPYELISAMHDGEIDERERAAVEEHLRACPTCRDLAGDLAALGKVLSEDPVPPVPEGLAARIGWSLRSRDAARRRVGRVPLPGPRMLTALGGVAAALLLAVVFVHEKEVPPPAPPVPESQVSLYAQVPVEDERSANQAKPASPGGDGSGVASSGGSAGGTLGSVAGGNPAAKGIKENDAMRNEAPSAGKRQSEDLDNLRSLGYVGATAREPGAGGTGLPRKSPRASGPLGGGATGSGPGTMEGRGAAPETPQFSPAPAEKVAPNAVPPPPPPPQPQPPRDAPAAAASPAPSRTPSGDDAREEAKKSVGREQAQTPPVAAKQVPQMEPGLAGDVDPESGLITKGDSADKARDRRKDEAAAAVPPCTAGSGLGQSSRRWIASAPALPLRGTIRDTGPDLAALAARLGGTICLESDRATAAVFVLDVPVPRWPELRDALKARIDGRLSASDPPASGIDAVRVVLRPR